MTAQVDSDIQDGVCTVEPLNNGHIGGREFVLCREVVLFRRLKNTTTISLVPRNVERLSLFLEGPFIRGSTVFDIQDNV